MLNPILDPGTIVLKKSCSVIVSYNLDQFWNYLHSFDVDISIGHITAMIKNGFREIEERVTLLRVNNKQSTYVSRQVFEGFPKDMIIYICYVLPR